MQPVAEDQQWLVRKARTMSHINLEPHMVMINKSFYDIYVVV